MTNLFIRSRQIGELAMIPFYLVGGPLIGLWIGSWSDQYFDTVPYLRIIFIMLGFINGARESWRVVIRISEAQDDVKN
ncbi:conserved hypothetical protein [Gammaproteobacteria bacterium]